MQARYRWFRIQLPGGTGSLQSIIARNPLTTDTNRGFTQVEGALGSPVYRFLLRSKVVITQFDESGTPSFEEVLTVNSTDFAVISVAGETYLRMENPGRSMRDLLNAIESLVGLGFTCRPVTFGSSKPTTVFEAIEITKMTRLKITQAVIDDDLVARMDFASKQGITLDKLTILDGVPHNIESASYEFNFEGVKGCLTVANNGTVKVSGQLAPRLIHLIETDLPKL